MKIANYIGGFRPFHNGHISMISQALNDFDKVRIIVGSYQNAISIRCPFTGKQRVEIIQQWIVNNNMADCVIVSTNDDFLTDVEWLDSLEQFVENDETFIVSEREGTDYIDALKSRFNVKTYPVINTISAVQIRNALFDDEYPHMKFIKNNVPIESYEFLVWYQKTPEYYTMYNEFQAVSEIKKEAAKMKYPPIYVCADAFVLVKSRDGLHIMLIRRNGEIGHNQLALPGGYVNQNEFVNQAAARELFEETGIDSNDPDLNSIDLTMLADYPTRSTRGRVISFVYSYVLNKENFKIDELLFHAGDDACEVVMMHIHDLDKNRSSFFEDHYLIIKNMLDRWFDNMNMPHN